MTKKRRAPSSLKAPGGVAYKIAVLKVKLTCRTKCNQGWVNGLKADRGINAPATRWKGSALIGDETFYLSLAMDGLHLVAGSFTARLRAKVYISECRDCTYLD